MFAEAQEEPSIAPEVMHAGRLVLAGQAALIAFSVAGNVQRMLGLQLLQLSLDGIPPSSYSMPRH